MVPKEVSHKDYQANRESAVQRAGESPTRRSRDPATISSFTAAMSYQDLMSASFHENEVHRESNTRRPQAAADHHTGQPSSAGSVKVMLTPENSNPPHAVLPIFDYSKMYTGKETAARWLMRLRYDFERVGNMDPSPHDMVRAIYMNVAGEPAAFIDNYCCHLIEEGNPGAYHLDALETALKLEYPPAVIEGLRKTKLLLREEVTSLRQGITETLEVYAGRANKLLLLTELPDGADAAGRELDSEEQDGLQTVIDSFVKGIYDHRLRNIITAKLRVGDPQCKSLVGTAGVCCNIASSLNTSESRNVHLVLHDCTKNNEKTEFHLGRDVMLSIVFDEYIAQQGVNLNTHKVRYFHNNFVVYGYHTVRNLGLVDGDIIYLAVEERIPNPI